MSNRSFKAKFKHTDEYDKDERLAIANTIMQQITTCANGPGMAKMMLGTKKFLACEFNGNPGIMFDMDAKLSKKNIKWCMVLLTQADLYDVYFIKSDVETIVEEYKGAYFDMLKNIFEETTGLYIRI